MPKLDKEHDEEWTSIYKKYKDPRVFVVIGLQKKALKKKNCKELLYLLLKYQYTFIHFQNHGSAYIILKS